MKRRCAVSLALWLVLAGRAHAAGLETRVVTASGQPLADAAVVLEPVADGHPDPGGQRPLATIAQRDREFVPYVTIVQTGTAVEFPNQDPFKHHLYSFSPAKIFEIKLYVGKPAAPVVFDRPGEVALGCNIHDWMEAYVLVVDSPYFAKTDDQGRAVIAAVPPGPYRLRLWHPQQKREIPARTVEIGATPSALRLVLDVSPRNRKPKPPDDADSYSY